MHFGARLDIAGEGFDVTARSFAVSKSPLDLEDDEMYQSTPHMSSSFGSMTLLCSSLAFLKSKLARRQAIVIHMASYAMKRPGHNRRPPPNEASGSRMSGFSFPSLSHLSGSNLSGSGYISSSRRIALKNINGIVREYSDGTHHAFSTTCVPFGMKYPL